MRFIHDKCGKEVLVQSHIITNIEANDVGISSHAIMVLKAKIFSDTSNMKDFIFHCNKCSEDVDKKNLLVYCMECNALYPILELFRDKENGSIYCGSCMVDRGKSMSCYVKLSDIVKSIKIKQQE